MIRSINSLNIGTVNAVSPCAGLQIIPFRIKFERVGANDRTLRFITCAMSPDRCGPAPRPAIARRYIFSRGVSLSNRDKEETLVEVRYRLSGSRAKTRLCNWGAFGYVPEMLSPYLQKVRVAFRALDNGIEDCGFYLHTLVESGL